MFGKRLLIALAILGSLSFPLLAQEQHGERGGGRGGGRGQAAGGHAGAPPPPHAPAGGFSRGGHFTGPGGSWGAHPAWRGGGEFGRWHGGHWWTGNYGGRFGSWWIVGPDWYWYPSEVAPIPDPYTPPGMAPGYWYWCQTYQQYYPYVGACPVPWQQVAEQ
ncbi:MAG: hypothetical protein ACHQC9_04650 [Alphaproteobacteria bacterium]